MVELAVPIGIAGIFSQFVSTLLLGLQCAPPAAPPVSCQEVVPCSCWTQACVSIAFGTLVGLAVGYWWARRGVVVGHRLTSTEVPIVTVAPESGAVVSSPSRQGKVRRAPGTHQ